MIRSTLVLVAPALALAGCGGEPATPSYANNAAAAENVAVAAAPPAPKTLAALPEAYRGKWGTTPADCSGGNGLMTLTANGATFFGSKAVVSDITQVRDDRVTAKMAYTNRMGNWQSPTTMTLQDDGKTLVREDTHPAGMFRYTRCAG